MCRAHDTAILVSQLEYNTFTRQWLFVVHAKLYRLLVLVGLLKYLDISCCKMDIISS